ncbi:hypothetical protein CEXT_233361 [Caerostris extrusa]|uniref:Uncharacterized protein n=1 Tax=Caerostris extrusa TaxID=172846 RepID=A0AAV4WS90_CAEEX|nr:hypothetical protein CEXT_233361 [Caerostris extrusa]
MHGRVYTYTLTFSEIASHQKKRIMPGEYINFFVSGVRLLRANLYVVLTPPRHVLLPEEPSGFEFREEFQMDFRISSSDSIISYVMHSFHEHTLQGLHASLG